MSICLSRVCRKLKKETLRKMTCDSRTNSECSRRSMVNVTTGLSVRICVICMCVCAIEFIGRSRPLHCRRFQCYANYQKIVRGSASHGGQKKVRNGELYIPSTTKVKSIEVAF